MVQLPLLKSQSATYHKDSNKECYKDDEDNVEDKY